MDVSGDCGRKLGLIVSHLCYDVSLSSRKQPRAFVVQVVSTYQNPELIKMIAEEFR